MRRNAASIVFRYPGTFYLLYQARHRAPGETVSINHGVVTITKVSGEKMTLTEPYVVVKMRRTLKRLA